MAAAVWANATMPSSQAEPGAGAPKVALEIAPSNAGSSTGLWGKDAISLSWGLIAGRQLRQHMIQQCHYRGSGRAERCNVSTEGQMARSRAGCEPTAPTPACTPSVAPSLRQSDSALVTGESPCVPLISSGKLEGEEDTELEIIYSLRKHWLLKCCRDGSKFWDTKRGQTLTVSRGQQIHKLKSHQSLLGRER